jgi:hypothetical protein
MGCRDANLEQSCNGACNPVYAVCQHSGAGIASFCFPALPPLNWRISLSNRLFLAVLGRAVVFQAFTPDVAAREGAPLPAVRVSARYALKKRKSIKNLPSSEKKCILFLDAGNC